MIYTSYFDKIKDFPDNIIPVAICGGIPDYYTGLWYRKPAPKWKFFSEWKENHDNDFYIKHYNAEVLQKLDPMEVLNEIQLKIPVDTRCNMQEPVYSSEDIHVALICYEKPDEFCHRHLFADWLNKSLPACCQIKELEI